MIREGAKNTPRGGVCKIWGGGRLHFPKKMGRLVEPSVTVLETPDAFGESDF